MQGNAPNSMYKERFDFDVSVTEGTGVVATMVRAERENRETIELSMLV